MPYSVASLEFLSHMFTFLLFRPAVHVQVVSAGRGWSDVCGTMYELTPARMWTRYRDG